MLGISLRDKKLNTWICQHTETEDNITTIRQNKHRWVGHVARFADNRWTIRVESNTLEMMKGTTKN